jgi:ABC-type glycerol-3-phosphate transport system substrate-binding protein
MNIHTQRKRTFSSIFLVLTIGILAAGPLFGAGNRETTSPVGNDGPVTVEFWHSNSGLLGEAMTELVTQFNATVGTEKAIVVREIYQGKAADVATKLRAGLQANRAQDLPDLAQLDATGVMDVRDSSNGALDDL